MNTNSISPIPLKKETISATKTLYIFNPEHDLALAVGQGAYTPPLEVTKLRKEKSLLPALYADDGDFILILSDIAHDELIHLDYYNLAQEKNLKVISLKELPSVENNIKKVVPWGWDHSIFKLLLDAGLSSYLLPSQDDIVKIRNLSHRKSVISFRKIYSDETGENILNMPKELLSLEEVEGFLREFPLSYYKAPWSSSGRGIIVSDHISRKGLMEWASGVLRKQGCVIGEPAWDRVFDFATEWVVSKGDPKFLGYSVFKTSSRGKYHANINASQAELLDIITEQVPKFKFNIIETQKIVLTKLISSKYEGPLGIDMLADREGNINPCVEINLRMTMGHIPIFSKTHFI